MPSSLIFAGLVVMWLLILVPAVARHQQEVARPSVAALSGRVLQRPQRRHRTEEVDDVHDTDEPARRDGGGATAVAQATRTEVRTRIPESRPPESRAPETSPPDEDGYDDHDDHDEADRYGDDHYEHDRYEGDRYEADRYEADRYDEVDDERWERPAPRYRPGRGGFDPEAAAMTARARYAFRQRVVLGLLIGAVGTAVVAAFVVSAVWWLHLVVDLTLVGYLVHLRGQVRMEEAIRDRRAARMAGTHRPRSADDPELDEWARRGREAARPVDDEVDDSDDDLVDSPPARTPAPLPEPIRVTAPNDEEPALPRLAPIPPPSLPAGTSVVSDDHEDPALHDLEGLDRPEHRRAAGE